MKSDFEKKLQQYSFKRTYIQYIKCKLYLYVKSPRRGVIWYSALLKEAIPQSSRNRWPGFWTLASINSDSSLVTHSAHFCLLLLQKMCRCFCSMSISSPKYSSSMRRANSFFQTSESVNSVDTWVFLY